MGIDFTGQGRSKLDKAIMDSREKPLSQAELDSFVAMRKKLDAKILPYISIKEMRIDGKMKHVPIIGIKGSF